MTEAGDEAQLNPNREHDRNGIGCGLGCYGRRWSACGDHSNFLVHKLLCERGQLIVPTLSPAKIDCYVLAHHISSLLKPGSKRGHITCPNGITTRSRVEPAYHWHRRLLRARHERPSRCRAAEQ